MAPPRILVVDDEPTVTKSCWRVLIDEGYRVDTVQNGREGLRRALKHNFDVVMTDLKMPDLNGMELVRTLRRERPHTSIVIITGYGTIASAVEATKLGVCDYLEKPFTPEQITETVDRALPSGEGNPTTGVQAEPWEDLMIREVLRTASRDKSFGRDLLFKGSRVLSGVALSSPAKAAIVSGDIAWIEKRCGKLSEEEREWFRKRLEIKTKVE